MSDNDHPIDARHLARLLALQVLYEADSSSHQALQVVQTYANIVLPATDARASSYMAMLHFYDNEDDPSMDGQLPPDEALNLEQADMLPQPETYQRLLDIIQGVEAHRDAIDAIITEYAPEWPLDQIAIVDRNILRIGVYELLFGQTAPVKVIINEAVRLAKLYGADNTPSFVNGVLGVVAEQHADLNARFDPADNPTSAADAPESSETT